MKLRSGKIATARGHLQAADKVLERMEDESYLDQKQADRNRKRDKVDEADAERKEAKRTKSDSKIRTKYYKSKKDPSSAKVNKVKTDKKKTVKVVKVTKTVKKIAKKGSGIMKAKKVAKKDGIPLVPFCKTGSSIEELDMGKVKIDKKKAVKVVTSHKMQLRSSKVNGMDKVQMAKKDPSSAKVNKVKIDKKKAGKVVNTTKTVKKVAKKGSGNMKAKMGSGRKQKPKVEACIMENCKGYKK